MILAFSLNVFLCSFEFSKAAAEEPFSVFEVVNVYSTFIDAQTRPLYGVI
jgi:hypothetical protein